MAGPAKTAGPSAPPPSRGGGLVDRLAALGLLRAGKPLDPETRTLPPTEEALLRLGEFGGLEGGLCAELDVRADELFGPLTQAIGGTALQLRLLDVRDRPELELTVGLGELTEKWAVAEQRDFIHNLNDLLAGDPKARAVVVLGEWNDALVLWCVEKAKLAALAREPFFGPQNRRDLAAWLGR